MARFGVREALRFRSTRIVERPPSRGLFHWCGGMSQPPVRVPRHGGRRELSRVIVPQVRGASAGELSRVIVARHRRQRPDGAGSGRKPGITNFSTPRRAKPRRTGVWKARRVGWRRGLIWGPRAVCEARPQPSPSALPPTASAASNPRARTSGECGSGRSPP